MLTDGEAERVAAYVFTRLRTEPLEAPLPDESEPTYTGRMLRPCVERAIADLRVAGFVVTGDGGAPQQPVTSMGFRLFPDIGIGYRRTRLLGVEVKFLRGPFAQQALATAIGQAVLYRAAKGYPLSLVFLVRFPSIEHSEATGRQRPALPDGMTMIERQVRGVTLSPEPSVPVV